MRRDSLVLLALMCSVASAGAQERPSGGGPAPQSSAGVPSVVTSAPLTSQDKVAVRALLAPQRVYVGQQATYEVGVFLSDDVRPRLGRNPEFVPPELRSMLAYDLPTPARLPARIVAETHFDVHVFQRALFPLIAGRHDIPPARLNYSLKFSPSIFSREESHAVNTGAAVLIAIDPPAEGRPSGYHGAVGRLGIDAAFESRQGRVGDPLVLHVGVSGVGNVSLFPRPSVDIPWGDAVQGEERVELDTSSVLVRGRKEFEYIITPTRSGLLAVPVVQYPYFNPYTEKYEIAVARPDPVEVAPGSLAAPRGVEVDSQPLPSIRREFRGDIEPPVTTTSWFWISLAVIPFLAMATTTRRRERPVRQSSAKDRVRQLTTLRAPADATLLRRDYAAALIERLRLPPPVLSNRMVFVRTLRRCGVSKETASEAGALLAELDASVFGRETALPPDAALRARRTLDAVDAEALPREGLIAREIVPLGTVLLVLVSLGPLAASSADSAAAEFQRAVSAYDARELERAGQIFSGIAAMHPRAADAWANAGTVAWQRQDTAAAVGGWQRALRLEPLAEDVRERLRFTPGFRAGIFGDVPPIPASFLAVLGTLLWLAGWGVIARARARRVRQRAGTALVVLAVGIALGGRVLQDRVDGRHTVVITAADRLRTTPALAADAVADVATGEVGISTGGQGAWTRLRLSDGRKGWMQSHVLESLELVR